MPTLIAIAATDILLLLIALIGLLRLCRNGGGKFGLTHFLWKQVCRGSQWFSPFDSLIYFPSVRVSFG